MELERAVTDLSYQFADLRKSNEDSHNRLDLLHKQLDTRSRRHFRRVFILSGISVVVIIVISGIILTIIDAKMRSINEKISTVQNQIDGLQTKTTAINQALSFENKYTPKAVVYNDQNDPHAGGNTPRCPDGFVLRGLRIDGYNYRNGILDCVNLKPATTQ